MIASVLTIVVIGINLFFVSVFIRELPEKWWLYLIIGVLLLLYMLFVIYLVSDDSVLTLKDIYCVIYGIISDFTDKGQLQYLTNLKGPQEGTYLYTTQFLSLR